MNVEIKRLLLNVCSTNLEQSTQFYVSLFDFRENFNSDWFVHLVSSGGQFELGIIDEHHEVVPGQVRGNTAGSYITFVVENVDEVFKAAQESDYEILQAPATTFYGQKRMLLRAPEGTVCDVSSPMDQ